MYRVEDLGELELDTLREVGNIGVGNAATSLSQMLGRVIEMSVPEVLVTKINELHGIVKTDEIVAGTVIGLSTIENEQAGFLYIVFPSNSAQKMAELLLGDCSDEELVDSAIMEVGNIISSSFCDAIANMLDTILVPTPPNYAKDHFIAVIDVILSQIAEKSDYIIVFKTELKDREDAIEALIMLFPTEKFFNYIFELLSMVE